jgi:hypothetical protein
MTRKWFFIFLGSLLLEPLALADVSYQEITQITGGSLVGMVKLAGAFSSQARQASAPTTSQVSVHGNRMVRSNAHDTEIIDLGQQTITTIDRDRHTYSVLCPRCGQHPGQPQFLHREPILSAFIVSPFHLQP